MASVLEYKCPNCGGHIKYDAATQSFKCEFCESVFTQAQLAQQAEQAKNKAAADEKPEVTADEAAAMGVDSINTEGSSFSDEKRETLGEMSVYSCQSCGAQITTDVNTVASKCPYCDSPIIMTGKVSGLDKPNCIIPFKLDSKAAGDALKAFAKGKIFLPSKFLNDHKISEIKGVYVPFWLYEADVDANISYEATRVRTWSDDDYDYTETSYYDVQRGGDIGYADVPVDASSSMPDDYMDGIEPFDYSEMKDFDPAFFAGFIADKYDVDANAAFPRAEKRIKNSTEDAFRKTVTGYDTVSVRNSSINMKNRKSKYSMFPVWLLNTTYGGKKYLYAVNGQTGRVSGTLPVDKKKIALMFAGIAAAVTAIAQFFIFM